MTCASPLARGATGRTDTPLTAPVIVVEASTGGYERAVAELRAAGWRVIAGFASPGGPGPADVRCGVVASAEDAAEALLAVLAGHGVVVHGVAAREVLDRLLGDLRHVGPVDHRHGPEPPTPRLDADSMAILTRLAGGDTLGEAAHSLGLSRRTADRRLADARRELGVERTIEAIARARRLGWLG